MTAIAVSLAYLGTLAAGLWAWRERRKPNPSQATRLDALEAKVALWDQTASDVENMRIERGLKPRDRK